MSLLSELISLGTPRPYRSVGHAVLRWLHPLSPDTFLTQLPRAELASLAARYDPAGPLAPTPRADGSPAEWPKYFNAPVWLRLNVRRVQDLGLNRGPRGRRILDLGSGAGYFMFICRELGHETFGMDIAEPAFYGEIFSLLGLRRVVAPIQALVPLPTELIPEDGKRYDLVTAFSIVFNSHRTPVPWGPAEWDFLLEDLRTRFLTPGGRVYLDLNPEPGDGSFMTPELRRYFLARGASVDRSKVDFDPLGASPIRDVKR